MFAFQVIYFASNFMEKLNLQTIEVNRYNS